jgi:hypothetical protein
MDRSILLAPTPPFFLRVVLSHSALMDFLWSLQRRELERGVVRWLRGKRMRTTEDMFNEFAAALQFPYYFGENWGAFDECLRDLSWLPATAYVIALFDSPDLLAKEDPSQVDRFFYVLESVCVEWSKPLLSGQPWDHPSVPFHLLFHCPPDNGSKLSERLASIPLLRCEFEG